MAARPTRGMRPRSALVEIEEGELFVQARLPLRAALAGVCTLASLMLAGANVERVIGVLWAAGKALGSP